MLPGEPVVLVSHPPLTPVSEQTTAERGREVTRATVGITGRVRWGVKLTVNKAEG